MLTLKNNIKLNSSDITAIFNLNSPAISLIDKRSGHSWEHGNSLFLLEFYDICNDRIQKELLGIEHFKIENYASNTLSLRIKHNSSQISFLSLFNLSEDTMTLKIPIETVVEGRKNQFLLKSIAFNPLGFSVKTGEEGYILLPNYGGMTCNFNHSEPKQHRDCIYLQQSQWEDITILPLFGIVHKNSAFLAIVESGEFDTEIITSVHCGIEHLNSIHPCFQYRWNKNSHIDQVDRIVTYYFLTGKDANYTGMAKKYRQYLMRMKGIISLREKISLSPEANYLYNAYPFIKIFCAVKEKQQNGSVQYRVYTTFKEAIQIIKRFKKEGIEKARFILVGWNWEGHDGRYPSRFPIDQRLGGEEDLRELINTASMLNYQITFHDNYSDAYRSSPDFDESIMIKEPDGNLFTGGEWAGGQSYFPCPNEATKKFIQRDISKIKNLGLNGWYYLDGTPRALRGCYDKKHNHPLTRRAEAEGILEQFRIIKAYFGGCSVEMPTAFCLPEVDEVAHIPCLGIWPLNSNLRYFIDKQVPFFHIAIHGLIIYHLMDWRIFPKLFGSIIKGILKEAEFGAMPRTEVTFRPSGFHEYQKHLSWIKKEYDLLCKKMGFLQLEFIENHEEIASNVYATTYSDNSRVIVNYSKKPYITKRIKVAPFRCELEKNS